MQDLSWLRARSHAFEVGIFCGLVLGLPLALDATLLFFLLLLFSRAFSDSFFQMKLLRTDFQLTDVDEGNLSILARLILFPLSSV